MNDKTDGSSGSGEDKPLWSEASFIIDFPELTMFIPSVFEADALTIKGDRRLFLYEFKGGKIKDLVRLIARYTMIYPGSAIIKLCVKDSDSIKADDLHMFLGKIDVISECLNEINIYDLDIKRLDRAFVNIIYLEHLFESLNNWLNIALLQYSPHTLKALSEYLEIPYIESSKSIRDNDPITISRRLAALKFILTRYVKYLTEYSNVHDLVDKFLRKLWCDEYKPIYYECTKDLTAEDHGCKRLVLLVPTLKATKNMIKRVLSNILKKNNIQQIQLVVTEQSRKDGRDIVEDSSKHISEYIVDFNNPSYDGISLDPIEDCIIIIPEFPKHMLIDFLDYVSSRGDGIYRRIYILVPKKPLSDNILNENIVLRRNDGCNVVVDINNRYSSKENYCLVRISDVLNHILS